MSDETYSGGCFCGAVRYVATGSPINVRVCHCRMCQRVTGQAFYARALYSAEKVAVTGETLVFHSSDDVARNFCPTCGTTIFGRRASAGRISLALGTFDQPALMQPTEHFWVDSAMEWVNLEGLPQYPEMAP